MSFWRRPQSVLARRVLFQVHIWTGVLTGVYGLFIGLTGTLLVFRAELQARAYPEFFDPVPASVRFADPSAVIANLQSRFPGYRFTGIDYPTWRRGTFLAYLARGDELKTVFSDPASGRVIGELPHAGWIQQLQALHFNFNAGATGYAINGAGASCLLPMGVTGLFIWWPGIGRVRRAFVVDFSRGWKVVTWELHSAAGVWVAALLLVWAVSGIYFSFPAPFRSAVASVAALDNRRPARSQPSTSHDAPSATALVEAAKARVPGGQMARFVVPNGPTGTYALVLARAVHGDWDGSDEVTVYFDRYSGEWLRTDDGSDRTAAEVMMTWLGLLHVGTFGGIAVKVIWCAGGLVLPTLFITGLTMWWNRIRPLASRSN